VRAPLYEESADLIVDTDARKVQSVVDEIERRLAQARGA
jgi:shikimate kinase